MVFLFGEAVGKFFVAATPALGERDAWNYRHLFVDFFTNGRYACEG